MSPAASSLDVRFVLLARRFDDAGYLYARDVAVIPEDELGDHLPSPWRDVSGGFAFLVDGVVWNSYDQPWNRGAVRDSRFDPHHFRMPLDTLAFVKLLLRGLAEQIDRRPAITAMLHEMTTLELTFVSADDVRMRGLDPGGSECYPPVVVPFAALIRGLVAATEQLLARARPLLRPEASADQRLIAELDASLGELRRGSAVSRRTR